MMNVMCDFNIDALRSIAKQADNKQIVRDVGYFAFLIFHKTKNLFCRYVPNTCFIIGQFQKKRFRIIGLCTTIQSRGKGLAKTMLRLAEEEACKKQLDEIKTISRSGADFYAKQGFDVIGIKHGDYILTKSIANQ